MKPRGKIIQIEEIGQGAEHYLYNGENLITMQLLKDKLKSSIDLIYIDPPYNTGKKMGKYNDNYSSHQEWVDFMAPRLEIAKTLLTDAGTIWISIGEDEEAYLKILCNQIFGEANKVASIIWQSQYTVRNDKSGISSQTEYILVYAKNKDNVLINHDPLRKEYVDKTYSKNLDNDPRGNWRGGVQLYKKKNKHSYTVISPSGKRWTKPWNYAEDQWYDKLVKENLLYWGEDGDKCPVKKVFLKDTKGTPIKNLWLGEEVGYTSDGGNILENMFGDRNSFLYPKPISLMKRILQVATSSQSTVLDFFAGSATMGHAILEVNKEDGGSRKSILITNNENKICSNVSFPRLKKVIEGYQGKNGINYNGTGGKLIYSLVQEERLKEKLTIISSNDSSVYVSNKVNHKFYLLDKYDDQSIIRNIFTF
jgi:adenine-specific DNA-methyltransferase